MLIVLNMLILLNIYNDKRDYQEQKIFVDGYFHKREVQKLEG